MTNNNDLLVVGLYVNHAAAKAAADDIHEWDKKNDDVKLGAMAILTIDRETGLIHSDEIGERHTKRGLGWGTAIGATIGILSGGIGLIPGMALGAAVGGGLGALNHKSIGMTDEQHAAIADALKMGGAGLGIMCDDFEREAVIARMELEGGNVNYYKVDEEVAVVITDTAAAQAAASEAIDDSVDEEISEEDIAVVAATVAAEVPDIEDDHVEHVSTLAVATGVSAADAAKLHGADVAKTSALLEQAATPEGRRELSAETGLDEALILEAAKKVDLMRIAGVGPKYAELLLASGVATVPELATRNAANLTKKLAEVNAEQEIVDELPSEEMVTGWVNSAKELPRMLYY